MRLSMGVPTYNQAAFLGETLESLLLQDEPFDEIVVSDNHCTDDTQDVLKQFAGRVRVVRPEQHLPMCSNWNFTVSQMSGEWVSLISSDDLAMPNFAASVRRTVAATPDAMLLRAAWVDIEADGSVREERHLHVKAVTEPARALYEQRRGPKQSFAAFALRRQVWERVGGFPDEVTLLGDWAMWLLAGALGKTVYCDRVISKYRGGHQSSTIRKRHHIHAREMFTMYDVLLPRATGLAGLGRPAWIAETSREQFRVWISEASRMFAAAERTPFSEAVRPWAEATGEGARLARFERGEVWSEGGMAQRVREALRPAARKMLRMARRLTPNTGRNHG